MSPNTGEKESSDMKQVVYVCVFGILPALMVKTITAIVGFFYLLIR